MEDSVENANEEVVNETPQDEQENLKEVVKNLENIENEQFDYYEENSEVDDNDEPIAFSSAMHYEKESSQNENIV